MDTQAIREQLTTFKTELERNRQEHEYLRGAVKSLEGLLRVYETENSEAGLDGHGIVGQVPLATSKWRGGKTPKGRIGFRPGLEKVLRDARGEPLADAEIWKRMQVLGVVSESQQPLNWVNRTARNIEKIDESEPKVYRWVGD